MLAAAPTLQEKFPGIYIDAAVSRSIYVAPDDAAGADRPGQLRQVLVLALGTNGPIDRQVLDEIRQIIGPEREMVVVNVQAPRNWTPGSTRRCRRSRSTTATSNWPTGTTPSSRR